jgi:hypothetical protein
MKVKVNTPIPASAVVNTQGTSEVVAVGIQGPQGAQGPATLLSVNNATDVDRSSLSDGSVLVFRTSTQKWTATTVLDSQDVTGGQY